MLAALAEGRSNKQIARQLDVSEQAVKYHLTNVYRKLETPNRVEALRRATVLGLVDPHRAAYPSGASRRRPRGSRPLESAAVTGPVRELRLAVTVEDYDEAVRFYRDVLGLPVIQEWAEPTGSGAILDAGHATLELLSVDQTALVDRVEVGAEGVSPPIRLALEVVDSEAAAQRLVEAGAEQLADAVTTPWQHRNVRLNAPGPLQLTLFTVLDHHSTEG